MFNVASIADGLALKTDGVWYGADQASVSCPSHGNQASSSDKVNEAANDRRAPAGRAAELMNSMLRREVANIERQVAMSFGGSCLLVAQGV